MCKTETQTQGEVVSENIATEKPYHCGYCGSPNLPIPYEQMYGPGAVGWDCCPDCGGV